MNTADSMQEAARRIADWLAGQVRTGGFPARTFYGESFALWLWQFFPGEFDSAAQGIRPIAVQQLRRNDPAAHPEFNAWALLQVNQTEGQRTDLFLAGLPPLNNTPNTNWLLLGTLVRLLWARYSEDASGQRRLKWHTRLLLTAQQQRDGLIRDDRLFSRNAPLPLAYGRTNRLRLKKMPHLKRASLQYHCFSLALLWEIWQLTNWNFLPVAIQRGHEAIGRFILTNGDTLYIGRGQQQIFGYGSLLYFLASRAWAGSQAAAQQLETVWKFVTQFQQADGRFPLVLRQEETGFPRVVDTRDPRWLGWYGYNNLFDYLPFLGVQLVRAAHRLVESPVEPHGHSDRTSIETTNQFAFVRQADWQMTLAAPGGDLSQDQPIPYLCLRGQSILPCFGGEIGEGQLYDLSFLPLPYLGLANGRYLFLRRVMTWRFNRALPNQPILLTGSGRWAKLQRFVRWESQKITIQDVLTLRARRLPQGVVTIYPLVFCAFELLEKSKGRYQIHPAPNPVFLTLDGQQGRLERLNGFTPTGSVQIVREALPWQNGRAVYQRSYGLTWLKIP